MKKLKTLKSLQKKYFPNIKSADSLYENPDFLKLTPLEQSFVYGAILIALNTK